MSSRVIAIDGPAGSGKSTTAKAVARRLGLPHVESGALYRAVTLAALDAGRSLEPQKLVALARALPIRLDLTETGFRPEIAGADVSGAIRSDRVTGAVSEVSAIPEVRDWVNAEVRAAVSRHARGAVLDGRDIGTVVFPDAPVKIYLTARPEVRAARRANDAEAGSKTRDQIAAELAARDHADSTRATSPLRPADDAVIVDTSDLDIDGVVKTILAVVERVTTREHRPR